MRTILVCDDEPVLRELLRETLRPGGYRVLEAEDGAEALAVAVRELPDLVVLDHMMPTMTGLDVLAELRRLPEHAATPVVVLTARASEVDAAFAAGADRFLGKPFSPARLLETVDALLDER